MAVKFPSISFLVLSALVILSAQVAHGDYGKQEDKWGGIDIIPPEVITEPKYKEIVINTATAGATAMVIPIVVVVIVIVVIALIGGLCCMCCRSPTRIHGTVLSFPQPRQQQQQISQIFVNPAAQYPPQGIPPQPMMPPPQPMMPPPPPQYSQQLYVDENPNEEGFVNPGYQPDHASKAPPDYY